MEIVFVSERLRRQFSSKEAILKMYGLRATKVTQRVDEISDARDFSVLQKLPALNCRPLTNNLIGRWMINVTPDYAMVLEFDHDPVPMCDGNINCELIVKIRIIGFTPC